MMDSSLGLRFLLLGLLLVGGCGGDTSPLTTEVIVGQDASPSVSDGDASGFGDDKVEPSGDAESNGGAGCTALRSGANYYVARQTRSLLAPVPNLRSVASDGSALWLMSATHNVSTTTIVRYDPTTGEVTARLKPPPLFDTLGTGAYGIEVDEQAVWVSVSGNTNALVRIDRVSGDILSELASPTNLGPSDLAWLGKELLVSDGTGNVFAVDITPPAQLRKLAGGNRDTGVATCNGMVAWAGLFEGILVLSGAGTPAGTIVDSNGNPFTQERLGAITFFGNELVIADSFGLQFYALDSSIKRDH